MKVGDLVVLAGVPGVVCERESITDNFDKCAACYKAGIQEIRYWIKWTDGVYRWICQSDEYLLEEVISI